jgi:hypothetical protein
MRVWQKGRREAASAKTAKPFLTMTQINKISMRIGQLKFVCCQPSEEEETIHKGGSYGPIAVLHRTAEKASQTPWRVASYLYTKMTRYPTKIVKVIQ